MTDFEFFQQEFVKWQGRLGLLGYSVYFKHERLCGAFASISVDTHDMVATAKLAKSLPKVDEPFQDVKLCAKHEAVHLLIAKLEHLGRERHARSEEITREAEELTKKLCELLPAELVEYCKED